MTEQDDSDERRTEGVRIIGAQEAAEAAGRPDVVRRRRRSEKKFGDRPDKPATASDLPKIKISTTETGPDPGGTFGAVPVVRSRSTDEEPRWRDDGDSDEISEGRPRVGHARIIAPEVIDKPEQVEPEQADSEQADSEQVDSEQVDSEQDDSEQDGSEQDDSEQDDSEQDGPERDEFEPSDTRRRQQSPEPEPRQDSDTAPQAADETPLVSEVVDESLSAPEMADAVGAEGRRVERTKNQPPAVDETAVDETEDEPHVVDEIDNETDVVDEAAPELDPEPRAVEQPEPGGVEFPSTDNESDEDVFGREPADFTFDGPQESRDSLSTFTDEETESWDESPAFSRSASRGGEDDWEIDEPFGESVDDGLGELDEEDTFVLPHWTEPATGQVPKVVSGVDPEEEVTFGDRPRWRDEGERESVTDFADLVDEGPPLGALGESVDDDDDPDFFADESFGDDADEGFNEFFEDQEPEFEEPERRRPRRTRRPTGEVDATPAGGGDRDLGQAVLVGLGLVGVGLLCFWLGGLATTILVAVILVIASIELTSTLSASGLSAPNLVVLPAVLGLVFGTYFAGLEAYPVVIGLTVVTAMLWYLWIAPGERMVRNVSVTLLAFLWVGFLGSFATLMLGLGHQMQQLDPSLKSNPGIGVMIAAVLISVSHDVGAYFVGRYLGSNSFSAASPNKTVEGLAGGVLSGIVVAVVVVGFFHIHPIGDSIAKTIIFAALCSMVAPLGDLCESALKRDLRIKDMGGALPGHGGVLDRFDAMLFVLPTAYFVSTLMGVWTVSPG